MQIQRSSLHRMMKKEGYKAFKAGAVNEVSDSVMEIRKDACAALLE